MKEANDIIHKYDDENTDDEESTCTKIFMGILRFFNFLKMVAMIFGICYFWVWTSDNRLVDMDVIEQLCKSGALDMTFHENRLFGKVDDATAKEKNNAIKREQIR